LRYPIALALAGTGMTVPQKGFPRLRGDSSPLDH
jgi:hypothetical protein